MDADDILNIFDSGDEITADEIEPNNDSYNLLETTFMKFMPNISSSEELTFYGQKISKILDMHNIKVCGIYFKRFKCILVEAVLTSSLKNWLRLLFEERNKKPIVNSKKGILELCCGKFNIIVNSKIVVMFVISGTKAMTVPCCTSFPPFGVGNGELINMIAGKLADSPQLIMSNFLELQQTKPIVSADKLLGIRIESHVDCESFFSMRMILMRESVNEDFLMKMNGMYKEVTISSSTFHAVPKLLSEAFETAVRASKNFKRSGKNNHEK